MIFLSTGRTMDSSALKQVLQNLALKCFYSEISVYTKFSRDFLEKKSAKTVKCQYTITFTLGSNWQCQGMHQRLELILESNLRGRMLGGYLMGRDWERIFNSAIQRNQYWERSFFFWVNEFEIWMCCCYLLLFARVICMELISECLEQWSFFLEMLEIQELIRTYVLYSMHMWRTNEQDYCLH
jgi:hypothetical protein